MAIEEQHEGPCGDGNVLYFNCINVDCPDCVIMLYSFTTGGNWVEVSQGFLYNFLQLLVNL